MAEPSPKRPRIAWTAASSDEEARAHLRDRLMVLSSSMFWSFTVYIVGATSATRADRA